MQKKILIVADPLEGLKFSGDTSLAIAEGSLLLGHKVFWTIPENIGLLNGSPVLTQSTEILKVHPVQCPETHSTKIEHPVAVDQFDKVLIRKDPPFDSSYIDLCWILSQCQRDIVVNTPKALLTLHEKLTPWRLALDGIIPHYMMVPTLVSKSIHQLIHFATGQFTTAGQFLSQFSGIEPLKNFQFQVLCKPWRGHAGQGIHTFDSINALRTWLSQQPFQTQSKDFLDSAIILQPLLPEIHTAGDRRVFVVNGEVVFDFVRWPAKGRIEANLAQGGSATLEKMPDSLLEICKKIANYLKENGVLIAGLDFIGQRLTEVNITSPTGLRAYENLTGRKISKSVAEKLLNF